MVSIYIKALEVRNYELFVMYIMTAAHKKSTSLSADAMGRPRASNAAGAFRFV
jgi:hypothetical protein